MSGEKIPEKPSAVSVGSTALLGVRSVRLTQNERRLLRSAIDSAIQNQEALIQANHDQYSEKPIEGMEGYVRDWWAEIRAWKRLKEKLSSPNDQGQTRSANNQNEKSGDKL